MILGLDISTSCVGIAIFDMNYKLYELSYVKFKSGNTNLFNKLDVFISTFEEKWGTLKFENVFIEEPLKKFKGKFSNADTIQKLTQMNAMISGYLYRKYKVQPLYFNVNNARSTVFPNLVIPRSHPNKKSLVWNAVMEAEPKVNWKYSPKTHDLMDVNLDMADAWVTAMAGIVMLIKQKQTIAG